MRLGVSELASHRQQWWLPKRRRQRESRQWESRRREHPPMRNIRQRKHPGDAPTQDVGVSIAAAAAVATSERPLPRWYREDTKPLWAGCEECKRLKFCGSFGGSSPPYWRLWRRHGLQSYELFVELPRCELRYASSYSVSATQFTARWKYEEPVSHTLRDYTLHFHWPATVDFYAPNSYDDSPASHWFSSRPTLQSYRVKACPPKYPEDVRRFELCVPIARASSSSFSVLVRKYPKECAMLGLGHPSNCECAVCDELRWPNGSTCDSDDVSEDAGEDTARV